MRNVFVVTVYGGEWEDKWKSNYAVCATLEQANKMATKLEQRYTHPKISWKQWDEMNNALWDYEEEKGVVFSDSIKGLHKLFPEYSEEDLKKAEEIHEINSDFKGVFVDTITMYDENDEV